MVARPKQKPALDAQQKLKQVHVVLRKQKPARGVRQKPKWVRDVQPKRKPGRAGQRNLKDSDDPLKQKRLAVVPPKGTTHGASMISGRRLNVRKSCCG